MCYGHFVQMVGYMVRPTFKGNEVKWNMKHPSDMPTVRFELRWWWSVIQRATSLTKEILSSLNQYPWKHIPFSNQNKFCNIPIQANVQEACLASWRIKMLPISLLQKDYPEKYLPPHLIRNCIFSYAMITKIVLLQKNRKFIWFVQPWPYRWSNKEDLPSIEYESN